jgi:cysteine-rich repeat protein
MIRKIFHRSKILLAALTLVFGMFFVPYSEAATSPSFMLDSSMQHAESSLSTAFSLCSKIPLAVVNGASPSFQIMAKLDCLQDEDPGGGGSRRREYCGNGILEFGEQCDDANTTSGDACSSICVLEVCGDAILHASLGEQCDDGNLINGDGCNAICLSEVTTPPGGGGGTPTPDPDPEPEPEEPEVPEEPEEPVTIGPICGNAVLESGEQCDDGNRVSRDGCNRRCLIEEVPEEPEVPEDPIDDPIDQPIAEPDVVIGDPTGPFYGAAIFAQCGNGILEVDEQCDDGNFINGDGCNISCFVEAPVFPPTEIITPGELVELQEAIPLGIDYLTNDSTTLFFEQFPEGSGEYNITLVGEDGLIYELEVVTTDEGYFSFQLQEELEDGFYMVRVEDLNQEGAVENLILEVRQAEPIEAPFLLQLGQHDLTEKDIYLNLVVDTDNPVLQGQTPLPATIAVYSEFYDKTFVVVTDVNNQFFFSYPRKLVAGFSDRLSLVAHYENGKVSKEEIVEILYPGVLDDEPLLWCFRVFDPLFWAFVSTVFLIVLTIVVMGGKLSGAVQRAVETNILMASRPRNSLTRMVKMLLALLIGMAVIFFTIINVLAATTTPNLVPYEGVLKNAGGTAITTSHDFRFSFWLDSDFTVGVDRDGAGAIPGGAPGNSGFSEVQSVTPDSSGFFNLDIGSVGGTIPDFIFTTHLYIQVEVKPSASADTAYETLDIDGVDNATDRQALGTLPYSRNSDFIDNRELGTSSGDIALLGAGDVFPTVFIPGGTDVDIFEIDANDDAPGIIQLSFGDIINNQILEWDPNGVAVADGWFNFTDDVNITGNLTVTGTINGVTIGPANTSVQLTPEYPNATLSADGTSNRGRMDVFFVDTDGAGAPDNFNYYRWSTRNPALQDHDVIVRFRLPDGFTGFQATPLILRYRTSDGLIANNRIDVTVEDTTGTLVPGLVGGSALVNAGAFTTSNITFGGGTYTAGSEITITLKMSSNSLGFADLSDLTVNFISN